MGESEKLDGAVPIVGCLSTGRLPERDQPRLLRVKGQPKAGEPLREHGHDPAGVVFPLAPNDEVISETKQEAAASHPGLYVADKPFIQHGVQEYIAQHRGTHPAYNLAKYYGRGLQDWRSEAPERRRSRAVGRFP